MTWAERIVPQLYRAQREGRLDHLFRIPDVRRVCPECPGWLLWDHRQGNPEGRSMWFIRHEPGLYSIVPLSLGRIV